MFGWLPKRAPTADTPRGSAAPSQASAMFGVWRVEREQTARPWRYYHFVAVTSDGGDDFRLECFWEQPAYWLEVTTAARGPADPVFARMLFADADCGKYVRQVMRIARRDVARRLARLDQLHRDMVIGVGQLCREPSPPKGGHSADP